MAVATKKAAKKIIKKVPQKVASPADQLRAVLDADRCISVKNQEKYERIVRLDPQRAMHAAEGFFADTLMIRWIDYACDELERKKDSVDDLLSYLTRRLRRSVHEQNRGTCMFNNARNACELRVIESLIVEVERILK